MTLKGTQRRKALLIVGAGLALCTPLLMHGNQLIDPLPFGITMLSGAIGFAMGCLVISEMGESYAEQGWRGYLAILGVPILTTVLGAYYGRLVFEAAEFVDFAPKRSMIVARVDDIGSGKSGGTWAYVEPSGPARRLQIEITPELYDRLDPIRKPGRDCLLLQVETGRSGYRRALLPSAIGPAIGVDTLKACGVEE